MERGGLHHTLCIEMDWKTMSLVDPCSPHDGRSVSILTKSIHRDLITHGYTEREVISLATGLLALVAEGIKAGTVASVEAQGGQTHLSPVRVSGEARRKALFAPHASRSLARPSERRSGPLFPGASHESDAARISA